MEKPGGQSRVATPAQTSADKMPNPGKFAATKAKLEAQPKVTVMLERREGEFPELTFGVNGVQYTIVRGVPTEVPSQIAKMLYERMESENKLAQLSKEMSEKLASVRM